MLCKSIFTISHILRWFGYAFYTPPYRTINGMDVKGKEGSVRPRDGNHHHDHHQHRPDHFRFSTFDNHPLERGEELLASMAGLSMI
uniref:Putative secreted protein n=1 Tax=Anopheles darlingi TaxID=43151 RepID=A0A2M4DR14_ANODA